MNRCASQNRLPLTFQRLLWEVYCTVAYDSDGRRCCLLWKQEGWVSVEKGKLSLTLHCCGCHHSCMMIAHGHRWVSKWLTIWQNPYKVAFKPWSPWSGLLIRHWNCYEWIMLLVSMLGRSCRVAGGWGDGRSVYWSVWTLHSSVLLMRRSFSLNTTHDLHKGHPSQHTLAHFSPCHLQGRIFLCVCVSISPRVSVPVCVCICTCVCNEGWFSTPGEAREVWGWPSLAVGEKYHLRGGEVIGCLWLSFWLIVGCNS